MRVRAAHGNSFDHLVGEREQLVRNLQAEPLRRLEIDDDLEFGGQHDREFGWLGAFENAAGVNHSLLEVFNHRRFLPTGDGDMRFLSRARVLYF
jgi:hypothetical protein